MFGYYRLAMGGYNLMCKGVACSDEMSANVQRRLDTLLLHVTEIIGLGRAGGGYTRFESR